MTTRRVDIVVTEKGARTVKRRLEDIGGAAKKSGDAVAFMKRGLQLLGGALIVQKLKTATDEWTVFNNRLRIATKTSHEFAIAQREVFEIAQRTRNDLGAVSDLYTKLSIASGELGKNQKEVLRFTELFNKTLAITGANSQAATAAQIQLAQALGSGRLQGDELRSILEANQRFGQILAKEFKTNMGAIRDLAAEGKIDAKGVFEALIRNGELLDAEFAKVKPTIQQAFVVLNNSFTRFIGQSADASGAADMIARSIIFLGENMETLAGATITALQAMISYAIFMGGGAVGALTRARQAVMAFNAAIAMNPIGAIAVAISTVITALTIFRHQIRPVADSVASLGDYATAAFNYIGAGINTVTSWFANQFIPAVKVAGNSFMEWTKPLQGILDFIRELFTLMLGIVKGFINATIGMFFGAKDTIIILWNEIPGAFSDIFTRAMNGSVAIVERGVNAIIGALNTIPSIELDDVSLGRLENSAAGSAKRMANAIDEAFDTAINRDYVNLAGEFIKEGTMTVVEGITEIGTAWRTEAEKIANQRLKKTLPTEPGAAQNVKKVAQEIEKTKGPLAKYFESLKDIGDEIESSLVGGIKGASDAMAEFILEGKSGLESLSNVLKSVAQQLLSLAIQKAVFASFGGGFFANGGVFQGGSQVQAYANGGVVDSPTVFPMKTGMGLMGEAGPEAIMPLKRLPNGKLGVEAQGGSNNTNVVTNNININVEGGSQGQAQDGEMATKIGRVVKQQVEVVMGDYIRKQSRPGGQLNTQGVY